MNDLEKARGELTIANYKRNQAQLELDRAIEFENLKREAFNQLEMQNAPPVDRTQVTLTDGTPITGDHREITANGQQRGYVVLSDAERAKGFVRPVRDAYRHTGRVICGKSGGRCDDGNKIAERICHFAIGHKGQCGEIGWRILDGAEIVRLHETGRLGGCDRVTTMGRSLAETYARDPAFYSGTFCSTCRSHFPVGENGEFTWLENDGREIHKVGT